MKTRCLNPWLALVLSSCALPGLSACGRSEKDGSGAGGSPTSAGTGAGSPDAGAAGRSEGAAGASAGGNPAGGNPAGGAGNGGREPSGGEAGSRTETGGSPELGGAGGGAPIGSCDELSCPDLGTCSLVHQASGCTRLCSFTDKYSMATAAEVARLAALQCNVVEGSLQVSGPNIDSLTGLESIHEITESLEIVAGSLTDLSGLKGLEKVGLHLVFQDVGSLNSLELPILKSVGGQASFNCKKSLETIRLPALESVGTGTSDELSIVQCPDLTHVYMDALKSLTGILNVAYNDNLLTLNGLPSLTSARGLSVLLNPKLPQCEMDAVGVRIGHSCSSSSCKGNDTTATCK